MSGPICEPPGVTVASSPAIETRPVRGSERLSPAVVKVEVEAPTVMTIFNSAKAGVARTTIETAPRAAVTRGPLLGVNGAWESPFA
jgi:hypothetical protein